MEIFNTKTFVLEDSLKKQGVKVLEEAAELSVALSEYEKCATKYERDYWLQRVREEGPDVIQTVLNVYDAAGLQAEHLMDDMRACYRRNVCRGRVE